MGCIYYKNRTDLTFDNQEHIFPAALHGIKKLPKEFVSHEANSYFSKLENHLLHSSMIFLYRSIYGPSKRKGKKEGTHVLQTMEPLNSASEIKIGFMEAGSPVPVSQIFFDENEAFITLSSANAKDAETLIENFLTALNKDRCQIVIKSSNRVNQNRRCLAYSNKTLYIFTNPTDSGLDSDEQNALIKMAKAILQTALQKIEKSELEISENEQQVNVDYHLCETMDDYRVFGKIAFNVLAALEGAEYVLQDDFDKFREWLLGKNDKDYSNFFPSVGKEDVITSLVPELSHWCVLLNINGDLYAYVCLYNTVSRGVVLAKGRGRDFPLIDGMICDWRAGKEYRLIDYIGKIVIK